MYIPVSLFSTLFGSDSCLVATGGTGNKEKAATKFNSWLKSQKLLDIIVYTNGSQEVDQNNIPTGTGTGCWRMRSEVSGGL